MDIATFLGLFLGFLLILVAILIGGDIVSFLNAPSVFIVVGGAMAATLASMPLARFSKLPVVVMKTLMSKPQNSPQLIRQIVELAEIARRDGILALEAMVDGMKDSFLIRGIQMAVDGTDPEIIHAPSSARSKSASTMRTEGLSRSADTRRKPCASQIVGFVYRPLGMLKTPLAFSRNMPLKPVRLR